MNRYIEKLILENEDLIDTGDWDMLYSKIWALYGKSTVSEFTQTLNQAGIFPIHDLEKIPEGYRYNDLTIEIETIPDNIEEIGESAYEWCVHLNKLIIGNNVKRIRDNAFQFCTALTELEIPGNVEQIENSAFAATKLEKLILHEGVLMIHSRAFLGTNLTDVEIPRSVIGIMPNSFPPTCKLWIYRNSDIENVLKTSRYKYEYID